MAGAGLPVAASARLFRGRAVRASSRLMLMLQARGRGRLLGPKSVVRGAGVFPLVLHALLLVPFGEEIGAFAPDRSPRRITHRPAPSDPWLEAPPRWRACSSPPRAGFFEVAEECSGDQFPDRDVRLLARFAAHRLFQKLAAPCASFFVDRRCSRRRSSPTALRAWGTMVAAGKVWGIELRRAGSTISFMAGSSSGSSS